MPSIHLTVEAENEQKRERGNRGNYEQQSGRKRGERNSRTVTEEGMKKCASEENDNTYQPPKSVLSNVSEVCVTASVHPSVCVCVCVSDWEVLYR